MGAGARARFEGPERIGPYTVFSEIGSGAAGTVHLARLGGGGGFARTVVIKRMHRAMAGDPDLVATFVDEARMASRIHHPNVVATLDVLVTGSEVAIAMDYVDGVPLDALLQCGAIPPAVAVSIASGFSSGLQAAHDATDEHGESLELVHRDVSPQNILVGVDGAARILDFGVAKATGRLHVTREGVVKGKLAYMPPEQLYGENVDQRSDVYAAGVVVWEMLTGQRLFSAATEAETLARVLEARIPAPSEVDEALRPFDDVVLRALSRSADRRFETARQLAAALEDILAPASPSDVGAWVESVAAALLAERAKAVAAMELSAARAAEGAGPPIRRRALIVGTACALLAFVALFVGLRRGEVGRATSVEVPNTALALLPADPIEPPVIAPPLGPEPPPVGSARRVHSITAVPDGRAHRRKLVGTRECELPYIVDADGRRHYKPECVR